MIDPDSLTTIRFSTAGLPESSRVAASREHYGHTVLKVEIEVDDDASFHAAVGLRALPGLQLVSAKFTAARIYERARWPQTATTISRSL
jgi:hypothetical protein